MDIEREVFEVRVAQGYKPISVLELVPVTLEAAIIEFHTEWK
jgi:hypothetical protein